MSIFVKDNSTWKKVNDFYVKAQDVWRKVNRAYEKRDGAWVLVYSGVTDVINFDTNLPPSVSLTAGGNYTFSVQVSTIPPVTPTYQWYFNGFAVTGATGPNWTVSPFYYSDNSKQVWCAVSATFPGSGTKTVNSTVCNLQIARAPFQCGDYPGGKWNRIQAEDNGRGVPIAPGGSYPNNEVGGLAQEFGKGYCRYGLARNSDGTTRRFNNPAGIRKDGGPSGDRCDRSRGSRKQGTIRCGIFRNNGDGTFTLVHQLFERGTELQCWQTDQVWTEWTDTWGGDFDLDPNYSYKVGWQGTQGRTYVSRGTNSCIDGQNDCNSDVGVQGGLAQRVSDDMYWAVASGSYPYETRPTPTPPA